MQNMQNMVKNMHMHDKKYIQKIPVDHLTPLQWNGVSVLPSHLRKQ